MSDGIRLARDGRINLFERLGERRERMDGIMRRLIREGWLRAADPEMLATQFAGPALHGAAPAGGRRRPALDPQARANSPGSTSSSSSAAPRRPLSDPKRRLAAPSRDRARRNAARVARVNPDTIMSIPVGRPRGVLSIIVLCVALLASACTRADGEAARAAEVAAVSVGLATAVEQPDHPIHPRQRHARRAGRGGRGRRDRRPRHRHAHRARQPA